jgi:hypothetical protein
VNAHTEKAPTNAHNAMQRNITAVVVRVKVFWINAVIANIVPTAFNVEQAIL